MEVLAIKEHIRELLERVSEGDLPIVERYLEFLCLDAVERPLWMTNC